MDARGFGKSDQPERHQRKSDPMERRGCCPSSACTPARKRTPSRGTRSPNSLRSNPCCEYGFTGVPIRTNKPVGPNCGVLASSSKRATREIHASLHNDGFNQSSRTHGGRRDRKLLAIEDGWEWKVGNHSPCADGNRPASFATSPNPRRVRRRSSMGW